eukprot:GHVU01094846.1.p2 GENE.GHVU01094846.1~~GHVU01094846.1.p2  ORF type:complete len:123 (-),score=19.74 GHVU01094846.1:133-501(-)
MLDSFPREDAAPAAAGGGEDGGTCSSSVDARTTAALRSGAEMVRAMLCPGAVATVVRADFAFEAADERKRRVTARRRKPRPPTVRVSAKSLRRAPPGFPYGSSWDAGPSAAAPAGGRSSPND